MRKAWVFDAPHYQSITQARIRFLETFLPELIRQNQLSTALDAGCGLGDFSAYLNLCGLQTTGIDGRATNITEAQQRHAQIVFKTFDIEHADVRQLDAFDLTLCFGLLYHLENPLAALRNLHSLTSNVLLIETMILPGEQPLLGLVEEMKTEDQGMQYIALLPSEPMLIKLLYQVGFPCVYRCRQMPDHSDFQQTRSQHRRRTIIIAAKTPLRLPFCELAPEPSAGVNWARPSFRSLLGRQKRRLQAAQQRLAQIVAAAFAAQR